MLNLKKQNKRCNPNRIGRNNHRPINPSRSLIPRNNRR